MSVTEAVLAGLAVSLAYASGRFYFRPRISIGLYAIAVLILVSLAWPR